MSIKFIVDMLADLPSTIDWVNICEVENPITAEKKGCEPIKLTGLTGSNFREKVDPLVMEKGYVTKTSLPVIYEAEGEAEAGILSIERLTESLLKNYDVVYLATNSAITAAYENVSVLYSEFWEGDYNGHRAVCVDTQCTSTGLALLIRDLLEAEPSSVEEVVEYVLANRGRVAHIFTWENFTYIKNSGKVRAFPAFIGKLLKCRPLCSVEYVDDERPLITLSQAIRGNAKTQKKFAEFIARTIEDPAGDIVVAHGDDPKFAEGFIEAIRKRLPKANILRWRLGPVIQAHGGPTSIHINYYRKFPNSYEETLKILP